MKNMLKAYCAQSSLVTDLKELYALVNVCRLALDNQGADETDTCNVVLTLAVNKLFELFQQQEAREEEFRVAVDLEEEQDAELHSPSYKDGLTAFGLVERLPTDELRKQALSGLRGVLCALEVKS